MAFLPSHEQVQKVIGVAISKSNKYAAFIEEVQESDDHQVWIGVWIQLLSGFPIRECMTLF